MVSGIDKPKSIEANMKHWCGSSSKITVVLLKDG